MRRWRWPDAAIERRREKLESYNEFLFANMIDGEEQKPISNANVFIKENEHGENVLR
ncbi:MAG: hypothetical protein AB1656_04035 [Candidatus Omnitrophota bacterium]